MLAEFRWSEGVMPGWEVRRNASGEPPAFLLSSRKLGDRRDSRRGHGDFLSCGIRENPGETSGSTRTNVSHKLGVGAFWEISNEFEPFDERFVDVLWDGVAVAFYGVRPRR